MALGQNIFEKLSKENDLECDYILTWGSNVAAEYCKFIKCKTTIGSFNNNKHKIKERKKKKSIVLIASKYRRKEKNIYTSKLFSVSKTLFKTEKAILPKIFLICKKLNMNFEIVSKTIKIRLGKKIYEDILKSKNLNFI